MDQGLAKALTRPASKKGTRTPKTNDGVMTQGEFKHPSSGKGNFIVQVKYEGSQQ